MWTKILYYGSIIYSAAGDAMGTFAEVLGSLHPTGAQIYRTNAITSYHYDDAAETIISTYSDGTYKYKPFPTEAPLQQWQLVDNGDHKVLEKLNSPCDTTDLHGRATMENVTQRHLLNDTYVNIGGQVTNYTPPVGTKSVTFKFQTPWEHANHSPFPAFKLQVCEGTNNTSWNDIENSYVCYYGSTDYGRGVISLVWTIDFGVGLGNDYNKGTIQALRPVFNMRWVGRSHDSNVHRVYLHSAVKHPYDGSTSGTTNAFTCPQISITAIGEQAQHVYQRTA
jgi:hypothetical protein